MIRLILVVAVDALGADATLNNGTYTAASGELSSHALMIQGSGSDAKVQIEKRN